MTEGRRSDDPFVNPNDPDAAAREQRRREREERRRGREDKSEEHEIVAAAPPPRPPELPPEQPPSPRRHRLGGFGSGGRGRSMALGAVALCLVIAAAAGAYVATNDDEPPPPPPLRTITLTVPEGYSRAQTAELAEEAGLRGDYTEASIRSPYLKPAKYGGRDAESLEGFLFPDTFELRARAPVADLVQLQLEDFKRRLAGVDLGYARSKNLTVYDVITIASMVEEEAQLDKERPLIAAVIYNRLREGIPLGIDATIRFATGNYEEPLTESELAADDPYNTRLNAGLPPGPISSPGLASIEAAARPAKVDYLYYVFKPGTCGEHSFSSSDVEFQADVARYNEAREEAGGESPDTCD